MKFNFDIKNKKAGFEADVEKIVEKGMDQHEKSWFSKFNLKREKKKEMLELKHKQRIEIENEKQKRKNWFEKREEAKIKKKYLEQELNKKQEAEDFKRVIKYMILMFFIMLMIALCNILLSIYIFIVLNDVL